VDSSCEFRTGLLFLISLTLLSGSFVAIFSLPLVSLIGIPFFLPLLRFPLFTGIVLIILLPLFAIHLGL